MCLKKLSLREPSACYPLVLEIHPRIRPVCPRLLHVLRVCHYDSNISNARQRFWERERFPEFAKEKGEVMKLKHMAAVLGSLILALGFSGTHFADSLVVRNLRIPRKVRLDNVVLPAGSYQLRIYDRVQTAEVVLSRGDKVVVDATADPLTQDSQVDKTSLIVKQMNSGVPTVTLLEIGGDSRSYRFVTEKVDLRASLHEVSQDRRMSGN